MNVTEMIISAVLKKGILYEAKNCEVEFNIPRSQSNDEKDSGNEKIKIFFKAENMILRIEKEEKS